MCNRFVDAATTYADLMFMRDVGIELDWTLAPTLVFQRFIFRHGTYGENLRLANMNVGFIMPAWVCKRKCEVLRASGRLPKLLEAIAEYERDFKAKMAQQAKMKKRKPRQLNLFQGA